MDKIKFARNTSCDWHTYLRVINSGKNLNINLNIGSVLIDCASEIFQTLSDGDLYLAFSAPAKIVIVIFE